MEFGLIELLVFGGLFFVGCLLSAFERYLLTVVIAAVVLVGGWFFFDVVHDTLRDNWKDILLHQAPLYLGAGLAVALGKWFMLVVKTASANKDVKETFNPDKVSLDSLNSHNRSALDGIAADAWRRVKFIIHWNSRIAYPYEDVESTVAHRVDISDISHSDWSKPEIITDLLTPKAKNHVDDIAYWIFFWPLVVVSTLFKDLIIKLAKHTARLFDLAFNRLSRLVISNAAKDI